MKKFFMIALAAMSLSLVSCKKGVEDQAKAYMEDMIEAMKSGDQEKAEKIAKEAEEWEKNLSEDDKKKLEEFQKSDAAKELIQKTAEAAMANMK